MSRRLRPFTLVVVLLASLAGTVRVPAHAQDSGDVPMFRGNPAHTGEMPGPGPVDKPVVLWRIPVGDWTSFTSSPAVVEGVVYVGSEDGSVYALDAATGAEQWRSATDVRADSSPAVVDGVVFFGGGNGNVYALDATTGAERWHFTTGDTVFSSPAVVDGSVYVGSGDGNVYSLDAATGAERWSFTTGEFVSSSPTVVDGVVYVGNDGGDLFALETATGSERWLFYPLAPVGNVNLSAVVVDGIVYYEGYALAAPPDSNATLNSLANTPFADDQLPPGFAPAEVHQGSLEDLGITGSFGETNVVTVTTALSGNLIGYAGSPSVDDAWTLTTDLASSLSQTYGLEQSSDSVSTTDGTNYGAVVLSGVIVGTNGGALAYCLVEVDNVVVIGVGAVPSAKVDQAAENAKALTVARIELLLTVAI